MSAVINAVTFIQLQKTYNTMCINLFCKAVDKVAVSHMSCSSGRAKSCQLAAVLATSVAFSALYIELRLIQPKVTARISGDPQQVADDTLPVRT